MMRASLVWSLLLAPTAAALSTPPPRIAYQSLLNLVEESGERDHLSTDVPRQADRLHVRNALETMGLFSITDIPGFAREKPETMGALQGCVEALLLANSSQAAQHTFPDGTVRQTIATDGPLQLEHAACQPLQQASQPFRATAAEVTSSVGYALSNLANVSTPTTMSLAETIGLGQALEHFHVYHATGNTDTDTTTLDWHTDQGLLLIFSPGLVDGKPSTNDFHIQLRNGSVATMGFSLKDEVVVLLGEGIQQIMGTDSLLLRAVPHALSVQQSPRVWYGRMVLPPAEILHPIHNRTFGELRQEQIAGASSLGCSSLSQSRFLQDETEEACHPTTQQFCWHRCMNYTEEISPTACANSSVCVNDQRELWTTDQHSDEFQLQCSMQASTTGHHDEGDHDEGEHTGESSGEEHDNNASTNHGDHDEHVDGEEQHHASGAATTIAYFVFLSLSIVSILVVAV